MSYCAAFSVLRAIELDNDLGAMTGEIGGVSSDRHLLAKMQACVFPMSQGAPEQALGISHSFSQGARTRN